MNRLGNSRIPRVLDIDVNNRKAIPFSQLTKIMPLVVKSQLAQQINCGVVEERLGDFFSFLRTVKRGDVVTGKKIRDVSGREHFE